MELVSYFRSVLQGRFALAAAAVGAGGALERRAARTGWTLGVTQVPSGVHLPERLRGVLRLPARRGEITSDIANKLDPLKVCRHKGRQRS